MPSMARLTSAQCVAAIALSPGGSAAMGCRKFAVSGAYWISWGTGGQDFEELVQ